MMKRIIRNSKYFIAFCKRVLKIGFYDTFNEWNKYYKRYVRLPQKINQSSSLGYKIYVWQNYLRIIYHLPDIDKNKIQKIVPKYFAKNILALKTNPPSKKFQLVDKIIFYRILDENGISYPKTYMYYKDGSYYQLSGELMTSFEDLFEKKMFVKPLDGSSGIGADIINFNRDFYLKNNENQIFQEIIQTESSIREIVPVAATSTIRINSYLDKKDNLEICSAFIKLPMEGSVIDNMRTGSIAVAIDFTTGRLRNEGITDKGTTDKNGHKIMSHPLSKIKFGDFALPFWKETMDLVEKLHFVFYELKFIAWDIAITKNGPIVIEGNSVGGILFSQLISQPYYDTRYIQENIIP